MPRPFSFAPLARPRTALLASAAVILAACSGDSATAPRGQSVDVAGLIAQMSTVAGEGQAGANAAYTLPASTQPTFDPAQCPYSAETKAFVCTPVTKNGLTFALTYYLYDASGAALSSPTASVASIRTVSDINGSIPLSSAFGSAVDSIADHQDLTLSALDKTNHLLNGTGHGRVAAVFVGADSLLAGAGTSHVVSNTSSVTSNVVLPPPTAGVRWPLSGSMTADDSTTTTLPKLAPFTVTLHAVITFNGSNAPTLVITTDGGTRQCTFTLGGTGSPVCG